MEKKDEKDGDENWGKQHKLPILDNYLPVLKTMLLMLEEEKKRTLNQIEDSKKIIEKLKSGRN